VAARRPAAGVRWSRDPERQTARDQGLLVFPDLAITDRAKRGGATSVSADVPLYLLVSCF